MFLYYALTFLMHTVHLDDFCFFFVYRLKCLCRKIILAIGYRYGSSHSQNLYWYWIASVLNFVQLFCDISIQALFNALPLEDYKNGLLVLGGDGRYFNREAAQVAYNFCVSCVSRFPKTSWVFWSLMHLNLQCR